MVLSIGMDEAGMGPIAGPVTAAVVVLDASKPLPGVRDSKKMTDASREQIVDLIFDQSLFYKISVRTSKEVDQRGLSRCWLEIMSELARAANRAYPGIIIVDGNRLVTGLQYVVPVVKADDKFPSVSAASILAKYAQCLWMEDHHAEYPLYGFNRHKGYPTAEHVRLLKEHGPCPIHRKSFKPVQKVLSTRSGSKRNLASATRCPTC